jgi:hypothetical protein
VSEVHDDKIVEAVGQSPSKNSGSDKESVGVTAIVTPEKPAPAKHLFLMNTKTGYL